MSATAASLIALSCATLAAADVADASAIDAARLAAVDALLARLKTASERDDLDAVHACFDARETAKLMVAKIAVPIEWNREQRDAAESKLADEMERSWREGASRRSAGAIEIALDGPLIHDRDEFWSAEQRPPPDTPDRHHTVWFAETPAGWKLLLTPVQNPPPVGRSWPLGTVR